MSCRLPAILPVKRCPPGNGFSGLNTNTEVFNHSALPAKGGSKLIISFFLKNSVVCATVPSGTTGRLNMTVMMVSGCTSAASRSGMLWLTSRLPWAKIWISNGSRKGAPSLPLASWLRPSAKPPTRGKLPAGLKRMVRGPTHVTVPSTLGAVTKALATDC